jgi:hypothetical protein
MRPISIRIRRHLLVCVLALAPALATAAENLTFTNDTAARQYIWVWPYTKKRYERPVVLDVGQFRALRFNSGEWYYVVATDDSGRETPFGRFNITDFVKTNGNVSISLRSVTVTYSMQYYSLPDGRLVPFVVNDEVRYAWKKISPNPAVQAAPAPPAEEPAPKPKQ